MLVVSVSDHKMAASEDSQADDQKKTDVPKTLFRSLVIKLRAVSANTSLYRLMIAKPTEK